MIAIDYHVDYLNTYIAIDYHADYLNTYIASIIKLFSLVLWTYLNTFYIFCVGFSVLTLCELKVLILSIHSYKFVCNVRIKYIINAIIHF